MKRSIKRLPKRTQEELAVLQELILQYLVNVRMIILYGSYARGEYVIWDETYDERGGLTYYQSDLDILVICDTGDAVKAENHANAFVVPKYDKRMEGKRHPAPPQIIVESTTTVNRAIRRKHYLTTARFRLANLRSCRIGKLSNMRRKNMQDASTWQKVF